MRAWWAGGAFVTFRKLEFPILQLYPHFSFPMDATNQGFYEVRADHLHAVTPSIFSIGRRRRNDSLISAFPERGYLPLFSLTNPLRHEKPPGCFQGRERNRLCEEAPARKSIRRGVPPLRFSSEIEKSLAPTLPQVHHCHEHDSHVLATTSS
jgi:hypothetical protein